jgi:hypothetical protein
LSPNGEISNSGTRAAIGSVSSNIAHTAEKFDTGEERSIKGEPGTKEESDGDSVAPSRNLLNGANFTKCNPQSGGPVPRTIDGSSGLRRRRRLIDDLYDKVRTEDPSKFKEYRRRLRIARQPGSTSKPQARGKGITSQDPRGATLAVSMVGTQAPIAFAGRCFTGATRPRRMMDDLFDKVREENPKKFAEYTRRRERARRQIRGNANRGDESRQR